MIAVTLGSSHNWIEFLLSAVFKNALQPPSLLFPLKLNFPSTIWQESTIAFEA